MSFLNFPWHYLSQIEPLSQLYPPAAPIAWLVKAKAWSSHSDSDYMGSIPTPHARNVPLLLHHERFHVASLPVVPPLQLCHSVIQPALR